MNVYNFPEESDFFLRARNEMVESLRRRNLIKSQSLLDAMSTIPRHLFVPEEMQKSAYNDTPLSIGEGQTISAPHMNAMMCECLNIQQGMNILEIGTGSGYHAALLGMVVGDTGKVYTIERIPALASAVRKKYERFNIRNVEVIDGDGTLGFASQAPYDRILVTAAAPKLPDAYIAQLKDDGGIICIPVSTGLRGQDLLVITKQGEKITKENVCGVVFVPLIGKDGYPERK